MFYKNYKSILSNTNGINIYRGCSHGCIYCDSRSECYHIDHRFEDIEVKENAPLILEMELRRKKGSIMVGTGSMCDPYCHIEKKIEYTRKALEVIEKINCGIAIQTKSNLILRDIDILERINKKSKAVVEITLTTINDELCKLIEPNVSVTSERIEVLKECMKRGIPTVVWLDPFLPYINDTKENIMGLLNACKECMVKGIIFFGVGLTLRKGNREFFYECLDKKFPGLKERYISEFGDRYEVMSPRNNELSKLVYSFCKDNEIMIDPEQVFAYLHEYPKKYEQISLF